IDVEVLKQHTPRELALLTKPIYDFLLFGDVTMNRPIPLGAVLLFYEDKKALNVKEYVERICHVRSRQQLSMNELIGIIEDLYQVETTVKTDVAKSEQEIFSPPQPTETTQPAVAETPIASESAAESAAPPTASSGNGEAKKAETPTEQPANDVLNMDPTELAQDVPQIEVVPPSIVNADALAEYAAERQAQQHALYLTFPEGPRESGVPKPNGVIEETLSDDQRAQFIRTVFENNENTFVIFMASINKARNWREAQVHLRALFEMNKIDILSPDVVAFTDAMHAYYEPALKKVE
ncbi:MAG: hypothetical protein HY961_07645, partial [Ignavibacteriae bacterium]|nr:hypothetical protein [Ignavibacteriota bacterium]